MEKCGKKMEIDMDVNTFSGVLPRHHNEAGCHNESQKRREILSQMKNLMAQMEKLPMCDEWDTSPTLNNTHGPYMIGEYPKSKVKPWDLGRVPSRELIGSQMIHPCSCIKRNGLQDDCQMKECRGRAWCLTEPLPDCPPFTKVRKDWVDPHEFEMCPNVSPEDKKPPSTPTKDTYAFSKRVLQ